MTKKDRRKLKEFAKSKFWVNANETFKKEYIKRIVDRIHANDKDRRVIFNILFE